MQQRRPRVVEQSSIGSGGRHHIEPPKEGAYMPVAYTTRAGLDSSSVGSIAVGNESYELHDALDEGGGIVVVEDEDTLLQVILDEHPAMKRTTLKAAEEAQEDIERKQTRSEAAQKAAETRKANESEG